MQVSSSCPPEWRRHIDFAPILRYGRRPAIGDTEMGYRVAVVGATGNVGREMLNILAERQFPLDEVAAIASPRSTGDLIDFGDSGEELRVRNIEHFDFAGWDMALFAAGSAVSKQYAPIAAKAGCTVIDNSS